MGPHATPVGIKTRGQDDIMFKCKQIFHLFDKIIGNSGRHFQSILIYGNKLFFLKLGNYLKGVCRESKTFGFMTSFYLKIEFDYYFPI